MSLSRIYNGVGIIRPYFESLPILVKGQSSLLDDAMLLVHLNFTSRNGNGSKDYSFRGKYRMMEVYCQPEPF